MSCTTDSTPSDNSLSPLMDDTKVDDDIIITSPNKTRTTEDLFAMIHRCFEFSIGSLSTLSVYCIHLSNLCGDPATGVYVFPVPTLNIELFCHFLTQIKKKGPGP